MVKDFKSNDYSLSQKEIILQQVQATNRIISNFNVSGDTINAMAQMYDYQRSSQAGKSVANAVLCLEALVYPLMTEEFLNNEEISKTRDIAFLSVEELNKKYKTNFSYKISENNSSFNPVGTKGKFYNGKLYMANILDFQQTGIEKIIDYYRNLIAFIFSLDEFKEIKNVSESTKDVEEEEFETI